MKTYNAKNLFFTADNHFGHKAILDFCERPYTNVETMDDQKLECLRDNCEDSRKR